MIKENKMGLKDELEKAKQEKRSSYNTSQSSKNINKTRSMNIRNISIGKYSKDSVIGRLVKEGTENIEE